MATEQCLPRPAPMEVLTQDIAIELKRGKDFVNWRWEYDPGRNGGPPKWDKPPINPHTLALASTNDPSTWGDLDTVLSRYEDGKADGIGKVIHAPFLGIDLDDCRDPVTGAIEAWAQEIIESVNTYTEVSPSGRGVKLWAKAKLPGERKQKKSDGVKVEMYDRGRYFTITGKHVDGTPWHVEPRQSQIDFLYKKLFPEREEQNEPPRPFTKCTLTDAEILKRARSAKNAAKFERLWSGQWEGDYISQSEADLALCQLLAFWTQENTQIDRLFRQSKLYRDDKWGDREDYKERTILKAISQLTETYTPPKPAVSVTPRHLSGHFTDLGNAERLVVWFGENIRFVYKWNQWLVWDGMRWVTDSDAEAHRKAKEMVRRLYLEGSSVEDEKERRSLISHALRSESDQKIRAMLSLAKSEPDIPVTPDQLDVDPWLLNCVNGTVDLRTGTLLPHDRKQLITKLAPVVFDFNADCPSWKAHISKVMGGKDSLITFLRRWTGYSLTGITSERMLFVGHGGGANGKTTTIENLARLLGDYAMRTPVETLLVKREGSIPNDLARLKGARFVHASEPEQNRRLAEGLIKAITGGDTISARFMRGEFFDFTPEFKVWLGTNHKPIIKGTDDAIWDRVRLVPFTVRIPKNEEIKRHQLDTMFEKEFPGILAWAVQGCLEWQQNGLAEPKEVKDATKSYRDEMDVLMIFIAEKCTRKPDAVIPVKTLYDAYVQWCDESGEHQRDVLKKREFRNALIEKGVEEPKRGTGGAWQWTGIGLIPEVKTL